MIQTDYEPLQKDRLGKEPEKLVTFASATGSPSGTRLNMRELGQRRNMNPASGNQRSNLNPQIGYVVVLVDILEVPGGRRLA